ncbi:MAG: hypothetical protein JSW51_09965 [Gemmatimonadota bacterium]|nr:MAG: hypothetical protein JSW51_09965 [Gemmatimonadota bacterium]
MSPAVCPEFCPPATLEVFDSIIPASVVRDSAFRGYVKAAESQRAQVAADGTVESNPIFRFQPFSDSIQLGGGFVDAPRPVVETDSFRFEFIVNRRSLDTAGTEVPELPVFRLPADIDSNTTQADLEPYLQDSTELAAIPVADDFLGGNLGAVIPGDAFPTFDEDNNVVSLGLGYRFSRPGFADLLTSDSTFLATILIRYAKVDSIDGAPVERADTVIVDFDSYVSPPTSAIDNDLLSIGGAPSARALIRVDIPSGIVDSSSVVRATLILVPTEPIGGITNDTLFVLAEALPYDLGAKSSIVVLPSDTLGSGVLRIPVDWTDTVKVEITNILRAWRSPSTLPHTISLRTLPEAGSIAEGRFGSSRSPIGQPFLQISFVPPIVVQGGGG